MAWSAEPCGGRAGRWITSDLERGDGSWSSSLDWGQPEDRPGDGPAPGGSLPGVRQGAEGLSVQQEAGAGARGHHPRDGGGPGGGHEKAGALGCGCARHLPGRNGGAAPGGGGTGGGEAPRPGGDSRLGQRDGAGDRGALAAAGGTRGSPKADAGHSGALLLPAVFAAIPAAAAPAGHHRAAQELPALPHSGQSLPRA